MSNHGELIEHQSELDPQIQVTKNANFSLADSRGFKILNMFNEASQLTITESAVESADYWIESANSTADSAANTLKIGLWVRAFSGSIRNLNTKLALSQLEIDYILIKKAKGSMTVYLVLKPVLANLR